jgi:hypothetical protein
MTTGTVPEDVKAYLSAVRARLDDLPAEERDDLLADVESSILDSAQESDAPVELRLGPPDAFADELRAAAGLPPRPEPAGDAPRPGLREREPLGVEAERRVRLAVRRQQRRDVLEPDVAVGLLEILYHRSLVGGDDGYALLVALVAAAAVTASVAVGLRHPRRNAAIIVVNLVLALAAAPVMWEAVSAGRAAVFDDAVVTEAAPVPSGLVYDAVPVQNIYAFDRNGRLLRDVRG